MKEKKKLELKYGDDSFIRHYIERNFEKYLTELFSDTGRALEFLNNWINNLENDKEATMMEKGERLGQFVDGLIAELQKHDAAMIVPGGIKLENIPMERHGRLTTELITDKALEDTLSKAPGLYGVIIGITPIPNLLNFIR